MPQKVALTLYFIELSAILFSQSPSPPPLYPSAESLELPELSELVLLLREP